MPSREEFAQLQQDLHTHMALSESVIACLKIQCRQNLHPMSVLRTTVSLLGVFDPYAEDMDERSVYIQAISIQAKIPTIVAAFARLRKGLDPSRHARPIVRSQFPVYVDRGRGESRFGQSV